MTPLHAVAIAAAGLAAGTVNTIVGSGSLITFPTLLAVGYPPVIANVSNGIGLVPGSISGAIGYRRELRGQRRRILALAPAAGLGSIAGAALLLAAPGAFHAAVPFLILLAVVLVLVQPHITRRRAARGIERHHPGVVLQVGTFLIGVYGGYFGAAQGVLLLALLGITLSDNLQRLNGVKNVLAAINNGVAAIFFILRTDVAWGVVIILVVTSSIGGQIGASVGRRIPPNVLRATIAIVGTVVAVTLLVTG